MIVDEEKLGRWQDGTIADDREIEEGVLKYKVTMISALQSSSSHLHPFLSFESRTSSY
jgi:hypothetical protein